MYSSIRVLYGKPPPNATPYLTGGLRPMKNRRFVFKKSSFTPRRSVANFIPDSPRMITKGILNPQINSLLSRVRHTNTLVISDRGFPFWPEIETVDISLVDDIPRVLDVIQAIRQNFTIGKAWMAEEFLKNNSTQTATAFSAALDGIALAHEPHVEFKKRVPHAVGLIRTGDTTHYANIILESA
jgi:D-ribose pyranase